MQSPLVAPHPSAPPAPVFLGSALGPRLYRWLTDSKLPALMLALLLLLVGFHPAMAAPTISRFDAKRGPVGSFVIVTGTELSGVTAVTFNNTSAFSSLQAVSSTRLIVRVPAGATSGPISVTTPAGTATSSGSFTVTKPKRVVGWGWNNRGQTNVPTGLTDVTAVAAGYDFSWALKSDGTIVGWGDNDYGWVNAPAELTDVAAIDTDAYHTMVLQSNGTVRAWGDNGVGQVNVPAEFISGEGNNSPAVDIDAGSYFSMVLRSDGTVRAWGDNTYGELNVPTGLTDAVVIEGGVLHCLAIKSDGTVVAWGSNERGERNVPAGLNGVVDVAAGEYYSLALKSDGTIVGWGSNDYGVLNIPAGLSGVVAIEAGTYHALALKNDGNVVAWGMDVAGSIQVPTGLTSVSAISAGYLHSLLITNSIPTDITLSPPTLAENQPSGTTVGTLTTIDSDAIDTFTYSLVNGEGDSDNASFVLDGATIKTADSFDFETKSSYSIRVQTNDGDGGIYTKALSITVTDLNEAPVISSVTLAAARTLAGPFVAVAPKTNDTLKVTVSASDQDNNPLTYTYTWTTNGQVTRTFSSSSATDTFNLAMPLHGDKEDLIEVTVIVSDGNLTDDSGATTTVLNSAPVVKPIVLTTWGGRSVLSRPDVSDEDDEPLTFTYASTVGSEGGSLTYDSANDGLFLYNPPATVNSTTNEVSDFSVSDGTDSANSTITVQLALTPGNVERYVALGASDVQGYGASDYDYSKVSFSPTKAYAPLLVQNDKLGSRIPGIALSRRAVNGFTVADALRQVSGQSLLSQTNSDGARAISLWYGPNDVLYSLIPQIMGSLSVNPSGSNLTSTTDNWLTYWRPQYSGLISELRRSNPNAVIAAVGTPDLGPALAPLLAQRLGITNTTVIARIRTAITRASTGINTHSNSLNLPTVDLVGNADITTAGVVENSLVVQPTDLASDGFHPNDSGYNKLAQRLWRLFQSRFNNQAPLATSATLAVFENTSKSGTLTGTDFENSALSFAKTSDPTNGTVEVQSNGSFTYTPNAGYLGSDSFTFAASDGTDTSAPATISITVSNVNDAPTNITLSNNTIAENEAAGTTVGTLSSTDADANDTFTYTLVTGSGSADNASFAIEGNILKTTQVFRARTQSRYSIRVQTTDAAGASFKKIFTLTVTPDTVAPGVSILAPSSNARLSISTLVAGSIHGSASDNKGVANVQVQLLRYRDGAYEYWNGTTFAPTKVYVEADLGSKGAISTTWSLQNIPSQSLLDDGSYALYAYATDLGGNKSIVLRRDFVLFTSDTTAPTVSISTPAPREHVFKSQFIAGSITGSTSDNKAVSGVKVQLFRIRAGAYEYWNGTTFTASKVYLNATLNTSGATPTWSLQNHPSQGLVTTGAYGLYVYALDTAGNKSAAIRRDFSIVADSAIQKATSSSASSS